MNIGPLSQYPSDSTLGQKSRRKRFSKGTHATEIHTIHPPIAITTIES